MKDIKHLGSAGAIPPVTVKVPCDEFENMIRKFGVSFCCEYFGYSYDSEFTRDTIKHLVERSEQGGTI